MMTEQQYSAWRAQIGLTAQGKAYVDFVRDSPPSRRVQSGRGNVPCRYPSAKMGMVIQAESHTVELPFLYSLERDPEVLEYYDQPEAVRLKYKTGEGKPVGATHTPDFLVIRRNSVTWVECKPSDQLRKLAQSQPNRYIQDNDGAWSCPPGDVVAQERGFVYQIFSSDQVDQILQRNFVFLEEYFRGAGNEVAADVTDRVVRAVQGSPGIRLDQLRRDLTDISADAIHFLIAERKVYVDLSAAPLKEQQRVAVFADEAIARAYALSEHVRLAPREDVEVAVSLSPGSTVQLDGRSLKIMHVGDTAVMLQDEQGGMVDWPKDHFNGLVKAGQLIGNCAAPAVRSRQETQIQDRLATASPDHCRKANDHYTAIQPYLKKGLSHFETLEEGEGSVRSRRRWILAYQRAEEECGCGFLGLLPKPNAGNRSPRLPERLRTMMNTFIDEQYESIRNESIIQGWRRFIGVCKAATPPIDPPSRQTFTTAVRNRPKWQQTKKRQGARAAYRHEPFHWTLEHSSSRHGDRPFEICHIDHTQLDVRCVCSETGDDLGRPWLTLMIDAYSRRVVAIYLTFDAPSYRSCMACFRDCVQRWSRLPQTLVVDGGKEFQSTIFEMFLATYQITKKQRPAAKARFGCVCERMFNTTNEQLIHSLLGNTKIMKNVRQVTKSVNPEKHAVWTLEALYIALNEYCFEVYDVTQHSTLLATPRSTFAAGLERGGDRSHVLIPYTEAFRLATSPTTKKGTARVQVNTGVTINYIDYWCEEFRRPELEGTDVPVRYDPFDISIAHAFVCKRWTKCVGQYRSDLQGRSEKELRIATSEIRARKSLQSHRTASITANAIAQQLTSTQTSEAVLVQRRRDAELRKVLRVIDGGQVTEVSAPDSMPTPSPGPLDREESNELETFQLKTFGTF